MINIKINKSNKCNDEYSIFVSFPFDNKLVNIMRKQPIRYWLPNDKLWEIPLIYYDNLLTDLQEYDVDVSDLRINGSNFNLR